MEILPLDPLPLEFSENAKSYRRTQSEGFVDEAVVRSVVARGVYDRVYVKPEEMVLSSCEEDFAGWALPVASPFRAMMEIEAAETPANESPCEATRRPAPPVLGSSDEKAFSEPGLAEPYAGGHRWWLFGACGALTCGIFAITLLSLAQHENLREIADGYSVTRSPDPVPAESVQPPNANQPALTTIIRDR